MDLIAERPQNRRNGETLPIRRNKSLYRTTKIARSFPVLALIASGLTAAPISTLYNTGTGAEGTVDSNYELIVNPGFASTNAYVTDSTGFPFNGPWVPNNSVSKWISPQASYVNGATDAGGIHTYRTSFDLAGLNYNSANLSFRFSVDNDLYDVLLNGVGTGISGSGYHAFSAVHTINAGFQAGVNSLDFVTYNRPQATGNPNGLRVEFTDSDASAVPEPGTWAMLASGLVACVVAHRRKRKA